jgi:hypothetical protein
MSKYSELIFESYNFDAQAKLLTLNYSLDNTLHFRETYHFDFTFKDYNHEALDRACQLLFFLAGVSYYKTYIPPKIKINSGDVDEELANFLSKTYQKGLGEFWFVNNLDPNTPVTFPTTVNSLPPVSYSGNGRLVSVGGGKDSLVSIEILRQNDAQITTWSLNHKAQLSPLVERIGLNHLWVERHWDKQLLDLNTKGAYNGHVPISSIFAAAGVIVAILSGNQAVVMSNENSANHPTLEYEGVDINHQYSKSEEFENDLQSILKHFYSEGLEYYSFLRPLSELRIAEIFAKIGFDKYKDVFSSCNRAFTHDSDHLFWDGKCPKCAFIFLILTPFIPRGELEKLFDGKNLIQDPELDLTYRQLLGIEGNRPLDCIGEENETKTAMELAKNHYPEIKKFDYQPPQNYDYKKLFSHSMPEDVFKLLENYLKEL